MTASGVLMVLIGVVIVAQVSRGGALQRLGLMSCPAGSGNNQKTSGSGQGTVST